MKKLIFLQVLLSLVVALLILGAGQFLPNKMPLFYSLPWGESQLVEPNKLLVIPASVSLISLVNLIILSQLHVSQHFFKKMLLFVSLANSIILFIAIIKIILIFF